MEKTSVKSEPTVIMPDEGDSFDFGGLGINWKIEGPDTGERFAVVHHPIAPHALAAPLHYHRNEDEYSYVLEGTLGALLGDDVLKATPGTWVYKPRRQWHTFREPMGTGSRRFNWAACVVGYPLRLPVRRCGAMATNRFPRVFAVSTLMAVSCLVPPPSFAETDQGGSTSAGLTKSYAYYVGKNLTADGSVLLGGTGEEVSSHWLEIVPRQSHVSDETIMVGVTEAASIPGELIEIPQAETTYKYISMSYTDYVGFPPPLTNGGMNEYQVAVRDVWSPSRDELVAMTPTPQRGPQYSDLARIAMQRAKTAREAVEIVGRLIDQYGYSTYGGNTHIFADPNEGWIVKEMAGGEGLWVAERLGPNDIRVSYPGYIGDVPANYQKNPNYMGSDNLISFAVKQGWYDPDAGKPFNVHEVYGAQGVNLEEGPKLMSPKEIEQELKALVPVSVDEMMEMVRDPRITDDHAGYGQVAHLRDDLAHRELAVLWVAPTGSVTAPFIPWRIGVQEVPPEFRQHRYLTKGSGSTFLDEDYQLQEATRFAGRVFKQLMYYTCAHPERFLPEVTAALEAFEAKLLSEQGGVEEIARMLYAAGKADLARRYLTDYSNSRALQGLQLGEALLAGIGARTQVLYDIPEPPEDEDINWYYNEEEGGDTDCLAVPGVDPDVAGDVPAGRWRTEMPGVEPR